MLEHADATRESIEQRRDAPEPEIDADANGEPAAGRAVIHRELAELDELFPAHE